MSIFIRSILGLIFVSTAALFGLSPAGAAAGWLTGWGNRLQLTIDHTKISSPLTNFPVLVHLSASSGIGSADITKIFSSLGSDDNRYKIDITLADGLTPIYVEIESWDTPNQQAWLWAKIPYISNLTDTILYLYYDSTQADNTEWVGDTGSVPAQSVWDDSFVMVQHLAEAGDGTPGEFKDSTARHRDGIGGNGNSNRTPTLAPSLIGGGQSFDGANDYIQIPDSDDFSVTTTGELTISTWISPAVLNFKNNDGDYINFFGKGDTGRHEWSFVLYNKDRNSRPQRTSFYLYNPQGGLGTGSYAQQSAEVNEWVYIVAKVDSQFTYFYRNGKLTHRDSYQGNQAFVEIHPANGAEPVRIGTRNFTSWFEGRFDEVRVSNISLSDAWINASFFSESDNLIVFGDPSDKPPELKPIGDKSIQERELLSFTIVAVELYGRLLTYSASNLPPGATFDADTAEFSWKPDANQVGIYPDVQFKVSTGGLSDSENITLTVERSSLPLIVGTGTALALIAVTLLFLLRRRHLSSALVMNGCLPVREHS